MLVTPKDVLDYMEEEHGKLKVSKPDFSAYSIYVNYSAEGSIAGRDAVRAGRMENLDKNHYLE